VEQIRHVRSAGLGTKTLALKLCRRQALRFPSFLLELLVIHALGCAQRANGGISERLLKLLRFLATEFPRVRLLDPANSNNAITDVLTLEEKHRIAAAAALSLRAACWTEIL
jgi:hypothetical protein